MRPSTGTHYAKEDSYEQIQMCLRCTRAECVNCLDPKFTESKRMTKTKERIKELWTMNMNDMQIAEATGLSHAHVSHLRNEMGLPAHRIRRSKGPYGSRKPQAVQAV